MDCSVCTYEHTTGQDVGRNGFFLMDTDTHHALLMCSLKQVPFLFAGFFQVTLVQPVLVKAVAFWVCKAREPAVSSVRYR